MKMSEHDLTLVLGGARGGKSTYAEALAAKLGTDVLYVATAEALDTEMRERVAAHQARRPATWGTIEAPLGVGRLLLGSPQAAVADVILLDCLSLLVSNIILSGGLDSPELSTTMAWNLVQAEVRDLLEAHRQLGAYFIIVSNEVGFGVVPPYSLGRIYRDCLGSANQMLARQADHVVWMIAGLPVDAKALPLALLDAELDPCHTDLETR